MLIKKERLRHTVALLKLEVTEEIWLFTNNNQVTQLLVVFPYSMAIHKILLV